MKRLNMTKKAGPVAALGLAAALVLVNNPGGTSATNDDGQFAALGRDFATTETVALRSMTVESNEDNLSVFLSDPSLRPVVLQGTGQSNEATAEGGGAIVHDPASIMGIFITTGQESESTDLTVRVQDPASIALPASQVSSEAESTTAEFVVRDPLNLGGPVAGGASSESGSDAAEFVERDLTGISEALTGGPSVEGSSEDGQFVSHNPATLRGPVAPATSSESESADMTVIEHGPGTVDGLVVGAVISESDSSNGTFVQHGNRVRTIDLQGQGTRSESETTEGVVIVHEPGQVDISIVTGPSEESEAAEGEIADRDLIGISQALRASTQSSESNETSSSGFSFEHPSWFGGGFTIGAPTSESESSQATFVMHGGTDLTEVDLAGEID